MVNKEMMQQICNEARGLAIDQVEAANSGHPGMPLGAMPMALELWANHMDFNPEDSSWINRDKFILSSGHASALLYALAYLFGYDYKIEDLKDFRQFGSKTPGHPHKRLEGGVEMTTGPLGQGLATAVGYALGERHLAARFNKPGQEIFNSYTYVLCGDGCLMEGITSESSSLAGLLGLDRLIVLYDSNQTTIDGKTDISFQEDIKKRYESYGWHYQEVQDGNDFNAIGEAIRKAKEVTDKPSIIEVQTEIGYGSPVEGTSAAHGAPLGEAGVRETKKTLGLDPDKKFHVSTEVLEACKELKTDSRKRYEEYQAMLEEYLVEDTEEAKLLMAYINGERVDLSSLEGFADFTEPEATRNTSHVFLNRWGEAEPFLVGGSADLAGSNKTTMNKFDFMSKDNYAGRNIHYGVREHAMGAIANGLSLMGLESYCATFFVFTDYMRGAIRQASIMNLPTIFVMTHDSIGVGEDGETHQPVEHLASFRAMPNIDVWRPADGVETAAAYAARNTEGPTMLALSRQTLPCYEGSTFEKAQKGGYVLAEANVVDNVPELIIIATGSEVEIAYEAYEELKEQGKSVRVVSMPCVEVFEKQDDAYREEVLPQASTKRIAIEAGSTMPWYKYVGCDGVVIGLDRFGETGPAAKLYEHFALTKERVLMEADKL